MLRFISCQQATLLIEQQADNALPTTDRNSLWLHLRYCPYCSRYARQSPLLNRLARSAADQRATLSADVRERLQQRLTAALSKKEEDL